MKQHITKKQLNGLSEEGREKLRKWTNDTYIQPILDKDMESGHFISRDFGNWQLLSIGQMIEFLENTEEEFEIYYAMQSEDYSLGYIHDGNGDWEREYDSEELCDALWEAVREVLEK